jgi:hypothetical protein
MSLRSISIFSNIKDLTTNGVTSLLLCSDPPHSQFFWMSSDWTKNSSSTWSSARRSIVPISLYSCKWCVVKVAWHGNINWSPDPTTKQTCCDQKVHIKIQICSPGKEITPSKRSTPCVSKTSCQPKTELELYFCNDFVGVLTPNEMSPPPLYTYKGLWWIEGIQSIKNTIIILFLPFQSSYMLFHKHLDDVYGRSR